MDWAWSCWWTQRLIWCTRGRIQIFPSFDRNCFSFLFTSEQGSWKNYQKNTIVYVLILRLSAKDLADLIETRDTLIIHIQARQTPGPGWLGAVVIATCSSWHGKGAGLLGRLERKGGVTLLEKKGSLQKKGGWFGLCRETMGVWRNSVGFGGKTEGGVREIYTPTGSKDQACVLSVKPGACTLFSSTRDCGDLGWRAGPTLRFFGMGKLGFWRWGWGPVGQLGCKGGPALPTVPSGVVGLLEPCAGDGNGARWGGLVGMGGVVGWAGMGR